MPTEEQTRRDEPLAVGWQTSRLVWTLGAVLVAVLFTPVLPVMALDSGFADAVVRLTDTATWTQMTLISIAVVMMVVTRRGLSPRRRTIEAMAIAITMLVVLAGNALLNEHVVKPMFGIPRPNIVALSEEGALGDEILNADGFYASGDKQARRVLLAGLLPDVETPALSDLVGAHWIHETGYSFPSGHTTAAMTLTAMLTAIGLSWLSGWRRLLCLAVAPMWAVAVAYSRVLLGVHTALDVMVATGVGFGWGMLAVVVIGRVAPPLIPTRGDPTL